MEQSDKIREKIGYVFRVVKTVDKIPGKFLKHMEGTDGFMKLELKLVATSSESSTVLTKEI